MVCNIQITTGTEEEKENKDRPNSKICGVGKDVLNYFDSLNWDVLDDQQEYKNGLTKFIPSTYEFKPTSFALRLVESQFIPYPEKEYSIPPMLDNEDDTSCYYTSYIPGVDEKSMIFIPSSSSLTLKEQHILYGFYCRNIYKNMPLSQDEQNLYKLLAEKASKDYPIFQNFVQSQWIKQHYSRCFQVPQEVQCYIQKLWETRTEQCMALYPNSYKAVSSFIPLVLNDPNQDFTVMKFKKLIFKKGMPPRMALPTTIKRCDLVSDVRSLCKIKPLSDDKRAKPMYQPKQPVSVDQNVDICLEKENIDIVITCSAVKSIVDPSNIKRTWLLPVTIKTTCKSDEENKKQCQKKVVIIDKALPPSAMSIHDKNKWYNKIVVKSPFLLAENPNLFKNEEKQSKTLKEEREMLQYEDTVVEDMENFGIEYSGSSIRKKDNNNKSTKFNKTLNKYDSVTDKFGIDCDSKHCSSSEEKGDERKFDDKSLPTNNEMSGSRCMTRGRKRKNPYEDVKPSSHNSKAELLRTVPPKLTASRRGSLNTCMQYKLWQLHKSQYFNMSKQEQRSLNVLVRTRIDGKLTHTQNKMKQRDDICVSSKMEFQPEYGAAKLDTGELVREYVDLFLCQPDKLCRVRTVGYTQELMLYELKTISEIKESLQAEGILTHKLFDPLYAVLTKLIDQPPGKYLLQHTPKMTTFAQLLVHDPNGTSFYLSRYWEELQDCEANVPPVPIDPFTLTKIHHKYKLPPAVLKPPYVEDKKKFLQKPSVPLTKRKKRGKSKRNKKRKTTNLNIKKELEPLCFHNE